MSDEFVDTNVLIYAHDGGLIEFYAAAIKKLAMKSIEAQQAIEDLSDWTIHRPSHADLVKACNLHRNYKVSWWAAMILNGTVTVRNSFR
jgi:predicted nucleic acid-binding protein